MAEYRQQRIRFTYTPPSAKEFPSRLRRFLSKNASAKINAALGRAVCRWRLDPNKDGRSLEGLLGCELSVCFSAQDLGLIEPTGKTMRKRFWALSKEDQTRIEAADRFVSHDQEFDVPATKEWLLEDLHQLLLSSAKQALPEETGLRLVCLNLVFGSSATDQSSDCNTAIQISTNNGIIGSPGTSFHEDLLFRSEAEKRIFDALKLRDLLIFPNVTVVLGNAEARREVDFLVCEHGRWAILEINGDEWHTPASAQADHARARSLMRHGVPVFFFSATECLGAPHEVSAEFIDLLRSSK